MNEENSIIQDQILAVGPWNCVNVKCLLSKKLAPPATFSSYVNEFWTSYQKQFPSAFNGLMLGLDEIQISNASYLHLIVKYTNYAEYVATRDPNLEMINHKSKRANPIGMTLIAISSDNMVIITNRSLNAEQNPGMIYFVGGYVEPPNNNKFDNIIYANAIRELKEEIGISNVKDLFVIGMASDPIYCHPELFLTAHLHTHSKDIPALWEKAKEKEEASQLKLYSINDLLSIDLNSSFGNKNTWSFVIGVLLLRKCWDQIKAKLS